MNQVNNTVVSGGVGFTGLLTLMFIGLKLIGVITWSWWWVLAPLWLPWAFVVVVIVLVAIALAK